MENVEQACALGVKSSTRQHASGGFTADHENAADASVRSSYRAVTVCPIDVSEYAVADDGDELVLKPDGREANRMLTVTSRVSGQFSTGPTGVALQSSRRVRSAISPEA
jgi:hypothetical protein